MTSPPDHLVAGLARRGAAWSLGSVLGRQVVSLLTTAVLARLLAPGDYGLLAMVATLTVFLQVFADGGLSLATVQRRDLTRQQVDNLFWVNTALGLAFWVLCATAAPILSGFYRDDRLTWVAVALGASFLFGGLAVQPAALLQRQLRFRQLSLVELGALLAAACAGVLLALRGFGYWALVAQAVVGQAARLLLLLLAGGYRPRLPERGHATGTLLRFGGALAAYSVVNYFARNFDNILVGKLWGAEELGYYSRAYFLMTLPTLLATGTLAGVAVPTLSALQHDRARMAAAYRKMVQATALFGFPAAVALVTAAPELVRLVYGPKWAAVVPLLVWLGVAAFLQPVQSTAGWLYVVVGRSRPMMVVGVVFSIVTVLGFVLGSRWGVLGIACSYALVNLLLGGPGLLIAHRVAGLSLAATSRAVIPVGVAALAMAVAGLLAGDVAGRAGSAWYGVLGMKLGAGGLAYLVVGSRVVRPIPIPLLEGLYQRLRRCSGLGWQDA